MLDTRNIYPLSDFQRNAKDFIAQLQQSHKPIVLTVNGKTAIVIQDATAYQALLDELAVARATATLQQRRQEFTENGIDNDAKVSLKNLKYDLARPH